MSRKHVHSSDPRKPDIVAALKRKSGGTKVTLLVETVPGTFQGKCMWRTPRSSTWADLGVFQITDAEIASRSSADAAFGRIPVGTRDSSKDYEQGPVPFKGTQTGRFSSSAPNVSTLPNTEPTVSGKSKLVMVSGPDADGGYDVTGARGWYHTGSNSFDHPEIRHFEEGPPYSTDFGFGPFLTWKGARKDLLQMIRSDIENLHYLRKNVHNLVKPKD